MKKIRIQTLRKIIQEELENLIRETTEDVWDGRVPSGESYTWLLKKLGVPSEEAENRETRAEVAKLVKQKTGRIALNTSNDYKWLADDEFVKSMIPADSEIV